MTQTTHPFLKGCKAGIPVAIGYVPIAIAFGLLACSNGFSVMAAVSMSVFVFAGASQFVGVGMLAMGSPIIEIALTTLMLNFRHFVMASSLSQRLPKGLPKWLLAALSFGITDESFALASFQPEAELNPMFVLGANLFTYASWVLGSVLGAFAGGFIPAFLQDAMGISLYAMFVGLLVPNISGSRKLLILSGIAAIVNYLLTIFSVSTGISIIITSVSVSMLGAALFREEE